jgi:hypothetical protein
MNNHNSNNFCSLNTNTVISRGLMSQNQFQIHSYSNNNNNYSNSNINLDSELSAKNNDNYELKSAVKFRFLCPDDVGTLKKLCAEWFPVE